MKRIKLILGIAAMFALIVSPLSAQEYGLRFTRGFKHITTKTTTNVTTATVVLHTLSVNVSGAGTTWSLTVQTQDGTPTILYTVASVAVGTTVVFALPVGITVKGLDIVTGGTTAGTMDVEYAYH